jgi:hypothetical protein
MHPTEARVLDTCGEDNGNIRHVLEKSLSPNAEK